MNKRILATSVSGLALILGLTGAAQAQELTATVNQDGRTVTGNFADDNGSTRANDIIDSYNGAAGILHVQQNNGSSNSINAVTAVATGGGDFFIGAFVNSATFGNATSHTGQGDMGNPDRSNAITDSFQDFSGIVAVQQNNGDNNEIGNATAVHAGIGVGGNIGTSVFVNGVTAEQQGADQFEVTDFDSVRLNSIDPSFTNAQGIIGVQQNNGNANAMGIATAVSVNAGGPDDATNDVAQSVNVNGTVGPNAPVWDFGLDRDNLIADSFENAAGIISVQQNNGDVNVLGIGNSVAVNLNGNAGDPVQNDVTAQQVFVQGGVAGAVSLDVDPEVNVGFRDNTISNSFNGASGIASVQQNNGSQNVMGIGNAVQANINTPASDLNGDDDVTNQAAMTVGGVVENSAVQIGGPLTPPPSHRENSVSGSYQGFQGLTTTQQNNGDNNVIGAGTALVAAVGSDDKIDNVANSLATVNGFVAGNQAIDGGDPGLGANRENSIDTGSYDDAAGILTIQQNNGSNNVIGAANTVVANVNNPVDNDAGTASNAAFGNGQVIENFAIDADTTDRVNNIDSSFTGASGIVTSQQNNGDNNVMGAAHAVNVDVGNGGALAGFGPTAAAAALGSVVAGNVTITAPSVGAPGYANTINASFNGFSGAGTVQQNNGSNNVIQSAISVSLNLP